MDFAIAHLTCICLIVLNTLPSPPFVSPSPSPASHHRHDHGRLKYSTEVQHVEVESKDPDDVHFYLYPDPKDEEFHEELILNDVHSIEDSAYDPDLPLIILIHGFTQNFLSSFPQVVKDAYLDASFSSKANIICVDWGKLSTPAEEFPIPILEEVVDLLSYRQAVENVPVVGRRVEEFLLFLIENDLLPGGCASVHLVGHSLGAHCAGLAARSLRARLSECKIGRITGTDPARPLFQDNPRNQRLDPTDADFVDIIHTNQDELGYVGPIGLLDFFVNGGGPSPQPGCLQLDPSCSHNMAWRFYAESIRTSQIHACPCAQVFHNGSNIASLSNAPCADDEKVIFGQFTPTTARGNYCFSFNLYPQGMDLTNATAEVTKIGMANGTL